MWEFENRKQHPTPLLAGIDAAKRFDRDLTTRIGHLTTLVQPAIILLVALFVGIVAYSMIAGILTSVSSLKAR